MNKKRNMVIAAVVSLTAGFFAVQNALAPAPDKIPIPGATEAPTSDIPTLTPTYEGCGYMWANHDDAEITEKVNTAVQTFAPGASANANLFGEDCVYADGHSTFSTMETDFYVQLPVEDLTDHAALGDFMKRVLEAILEIPREQLKGNDGFVDFQFTKSETESLVVHAPIAQYRSEAQGITGADLFQLFYKNQ